MSARRRWTAACLLAFALGLLLATTLVPAHALGWLPGPRIDLSPSLVDLLRNLALFLPVGVGLGVPVGVEERRALRALCRGLVIAALVHPTPALHARPCS